MSFDPSAKNRLTAHDLGRFPGDTVFDRLGRAVCAAGCLPRKELHEAWAVARRVRRRIRGGRVIDVAGGHGLLAHVMLLLDDTSPEAIVVDPATPPSAAAIATALQDMWPRLAGRVRHSGETVERFAVARGDVVVSCHACGALSDAVIDRALAAAAHVAVLPCCHHLAAAADPLAGWVDGALAVDLRRAWRIEQAGYRVWTQEIPAAITPKNRLLMASPPR